MSTITAMPGLARPVVRRPVRRTAPTRPAAPLRLTRRGRVVVVLALLAALSAVLMVFAAHSAATDERGAPVPTRSVRIAPGDTLWQIASRVAAPGHVRDAVHRIEELNAMSGPQLQVGQTIAVPLPQ
ncbi:MAG TPA: LysM peptidoglycan-binding domain-containing protein [Nocardioidaceae bacterium]|nr:LysM peptidoglycan-binding domain-containing protein [Nocardioidaceae bacterium]